MDAVLLQTGTRTPAPTQSFRDGPGLAPPEWLPESVPVFFYRLVIAVALVVFAYYLSQMVRQVLGRRIARRFKRPSVSRTILRSLQMFIVVGAVLTALSFFGLGFGNIALSVGVFSAVVGIIVAPIIGNLISGVFVLSEQPYEIGDMIELGDTQTKGFVEDITLIYTKVFTLDNTFIVLPNGTMRSRDVINYSAEDTRVRLTLDVGVTYESDISVARKQMEAAARSIDGVIKGGPDIRIGSARYPASPTCYIGEFGESEVSLKLRYWANEPYKQTTVRSKVLTEVWDRFDDHDIEIPYPHRHMVFDDTSGELQMSMHQADEAAISRPGGATTRAAETENETAEESSPEVGSADGSAGTEERNASEREGERETDSDATDSP
ncbi:MAG: mechanosensitive ion channel family protein [Natronomonas sp.]|jgi:small-conductance mechanosensitive channel|uniref:mechanosensitive ion channel family protein n=1 Tax=Natronomonas sp. TaxID=2184060 RepID=UPI0028705578|nr:mechanosensitive ion channel family protein [Natronomonas sp.]MDR9429759.1 mechanosensitive ion channel family protein [Natronomonas sp.]